MDIMIYLLFLEQFVISTNMEIYINFKNHF